MSLRFLIVHTPQIFELMVYSHDAEWLLSCENFVMTIPTYIGSYRVEETLGQGGFGVVYRAYQPFLDREVAIKMLRADATDPRIAESFTHEARTIAKLRHKGIVGVHEFGLLPGEQNQTYMVMEFLSGETLEDYLKRGELIDSARLVEIVEALSNALDYAHRHGVVHRDLKPANILFSEQGEPVIVDFGLAKLLEITEGAMPNPSADGESTINGTPFYMAPEQLMGQRAAAASDQYALALIAYQMLTRHLPHESENITGLIIQRMNSQPTSIDKYVPGLPPEVSEAFKKALALKPEDRFETATDFAHALGEAFFPGRMSAAKVVTVADPLQTAMLYTTRRMLRSFLITASALVGLIILYCLSLYIRGYLVGSPAFFLWDGLISHPYQASESERLVIGVWPGSVADQAGVRPGDHYSRVKNPVGAWVDEMTVNDSPRQILPPSYTFIKGDEIRRRFTRGDEVINVRYALEQNSYYLMTMITYVMVSALTLGCGLWLLNLWGAEPGLQVLFPLFLAASMFLISRAMEDLIPFIDVVVSHIVLPALIQFMLVFPRPMAWVEKYPRRVWLLYVPLIIPLIEFMTGQRIEINGVHVPFYSFIAYAVGILFLLFYKWVRVDWKSFPGMKWIMIGFGMIAAFTILDQIILTMSSEAVISLYGNGAYRQMQTALQVPIMIAIVSLMVSLGYHTVQKQLGASMALTHTTQLREMTKVTSRLSKKDSKDL